MKLQYSVICALVTAACARKCMNISIPVRIEARNGNFDIKPLETEIQLTDFFLRFSRPGQNFTSELLQGVSKSVGLYIISRQKVDPLT